MLSLMKIKIISLSNYSTKLLTNLLTNLPFSLFLCCSLPSFYSLRPELFSRYLLGRDPHHKRSESQLQKYSPLHVNKILIPFNPDSNPHNPPIKKIQPTKNVPPSTSCCMVCFLYKKIYKKDPRPIIYYIIIHLQLG